MKIQPKSFDEFDLHCPLMRFYTETCAALGRIATILPEGTVQLAHTDIDGQPVVTFQFLEPGYDREALSIDITMADWHDKSKGDVHGVADAIAGSFREAYRATLPAPTTAKEAIDPRD